jgi:hypothetical protein
MTGFWLRWMSIWCWGVIAFGIVLLTSAIEALRMPAMLFLDLVFWPIDGQPAVMSREAVFATSILGAVTIGWGVLMLALVRDPEIAAHPRLRRHLGVALGIWFVVDSTASILTGAWVNAISNTVIAAAGVVPLLASHRGGSAAPGRPATLSR